MGAIRSAAAVVAIGLGAALPAIAASPAKPVPGNAAAPEAIGHPPEPAGYRMDHYRAPVPATLAGGTVVDTAAAVHLHDQGVPFIDVLPRAPRPKNLPKGTIWRPEPRQDIPGSIWLVDTGYGELAPVMQRYFLDGVAKATMGDKAAPVLFYCKPDCWMSYNAAKRAIAAGYASVYWYPEGADGWKQSGRPLEKREPEPRPDE
ncbi:PQQ-dependent catabolism-associated CXXCW motif protein [Jiella sp. MQZ9-1]|uniref:PQQ-dependent catabolism-associated CXXCW motif protein n=1 Tax=Jiella flava TaxID=2816857 RepID=A0A939JRM0_9HYPH|nr:PQQ-dependent catabolism-associated CXXCW motif protein [Jiella flava]MBO0662043.1 PQQ-dependent catabolism-associated CXXCW motif protein [Jiella flava]MCD2470630.1 PQQ-dependent catabolism-associated CXXCW motif protein [Jiella flava]